MVKVQSENRYVDLWRNRYQRSVFKTCVIVYVYNKHFIVFLDFVIANFGPTASPYFCLQKKQLGKFVSKANDSLVCGSFQWKTLQGFVFKRIENSHTLEILITFIINFIFKAIPLFYYCVINGDFAILSVCGNIALDFLYDILGVRRFLRYNINLPINTVYIQLAIDELIFVMYFSIHIKNLLLVIIFLYIQNEEFQIWFCLFYFLHNLRMLSIQIVKMERIPLDNNTVGKVFAQKQFVPFLQQLILSQDFLVCPIWSLQQLLHDFLSFVRLDFFLKILIDFYDFLFASILGIFFIQYQVLFNEILLFDFHLHLIFLFQLLFDLLQSGHLPGFDFMTFLLRVIFAHYKYP